MGYYTPDPYYQPEKFGLTIVAESDMSGSYEFDMFVVWKDVNNNLYWAYDAGCSCPSPFEDYTAVSDLEHGTKTELTRAYQAWYNEQYSKDEIEHSNMLAHLMTL